MRDFTLIFLSRIRSSPLLLGDFPKVLALCLLVLVEFDLGVTHFEVIDILAIVLEIVHVNVLIHILLTGVATLS